MLRRPLIAILAALVLTLSGGALVSGNPAAAATPIEVETETRRFVGQGVSSFGLELYYARIDAQNQANSAGFYDCTEIDIWEWPDGLAWVTWECTRRSLTEVATGHTVPRGRPAAGTAGRCRPIGATRHGE